MKKNKSIITNIICSVVFLAIIYVLIGKVYSITVNYSPSSKAEFMKASPEDILGKSIDESTGSFWDSLDKQGQLGCFHHQATGGMSNKINSIYDIGFNTNKGVMQIYSIMDTSPRKSMTSYAGENNPTVGKLIAERGLEKNIKESSINDVDYRNNLIDIFIHDEKLNHDLEELEINGCYFKNVDFSNILVRNCDFIDCIFENCNLMGIDFSSKSIHRVCFKNCNLGSTNYIMSSIKDVLFDDCKCDYINFSDSKIDTLEVQDSLFREGRFVNTKLKNVAFNEVNFRACEFLNTPLKDIDFSSCDISNIKVNANDIKEMIVNENQALMLVNLLGIIVKE